MHEFNHETLSWTEKATLPYATHRHCSVADEESGFLWMIGGNTASVGDRSEVHFYTVSKNTWTHHSNMNSASIDPACGIVKRNNGDKWLLIVKAHQGSAVIYYDLTNSVGWTHLSNLWNNYNAYQMMMVTLDPYTPFLVGSGSYVHGNSLRNFWEFNYLNSAFEDGYYYLQNEHVYGYVASLNKTKHNRALQNCMAIRTYVAVGWGGNSFSTAWSVMLRKRIQSGNNKLPLSCHGIIPLLSPGKTEVGVTAVGYWLLVCGGQQKGASSMESQCHKLNTQNNEGTAAWTDMDAMPVARGLFEFVTYANAAYAVGGRTITSIYSRMARVDRWTKAGWTQMSDMPTAMIAHCAVSDEGYNSIFVLGGYVGGKGNSKTAYRYKVDQDEWVALQPLQWGVRMGGCAIMTRKGNGHRIMLLVGNSDTSHRTQYYDLTTDSGWHTWTDSIYYQQATTLVSLTPTESYEVWFIPFF